MNQDSESLIYLVLMVCIGVVILSLLAALYLTGKSRKVSTKDIKLGLHEIAEVCAKSSEKIAELDRQIIDSMKSLSPPAHEIFSLAKQVIALLESRADKVRELVDTGRLEDLYRAHRLITSPLENTGDHLSSLVFAATVIELEPGQYNMAMDSMLSSVQRELEGEKVSDLGFRVDKSGYRRRKFTIRGLLKQLQGKG